MKLIPYKVGSKSAADLATALGIKRIRQQGDTLTLRNNEVVINWGNSSIGRNIRGARFINPPSAVANAVNKLTALTMMDEGDVDTPDFTTDIAQARAWIQDNRKVVCRTKLSSYGGAGIVIAEREDQLVDAPLYVRYMPKEHEYRVHVMNGQVFFVQRKARKMDVPDERVNWQVRNLEGGFIYANQNIEVADTVRDNAVRAVASLGLDFGAVDVLVTQRGRPYVLEVNTACGLAGTTLERYVEAFRTNYAG